ncbi:hypothetical protein MCOR27_009274 [Pyricularia oryzae]|uniref:CBM1 domain-containing protein n=3 Tax=Pyricularia TaxID=48558 RepID=A0ABQ8NLM4_PYRGI|nr:cellobiose dehydrogenase [Pyricularia oryzae 70-15]KAH8848288.1 hypothetical protein MCOR01_001666 [Pyricularia oryzae]KAI6298926.1 hypothetical protein MCOR33_005044 [Pyricularia grisea]EHA53095.1 cellobiose dehydrogenase [Pyricularia oryzae 70-15]KAH9429771.1 hypothetical protein MCOR02_009508 [Pyricularia oryzae]KAI6257607.1 hypothetical protein MCOR19_006010 [Pyricularia oryzae]
MRTLAPFIATLLVAVTYLQPSLAQGPLPQVYTDPETGIVFNTWSATDGPIQGEGYGSVSLGGFTFGMALPSDALTVDANEFIGYLECSTPTTPGEGWCGVSMGGSMTRALLLVAWPHEDEVLTSFRYATGFVVPELYKGDAKLTQITSSMNSTHYKLVFRCQNCLKWSHDGLEGGQSTSSSFLMLGWGQARTPVGNPECPDRVVIQQHDNGMNLFPAPLDVSIANPSYASWAATATKEVTGDCGGSTEPPVPEVTGVPVPSGTYDYVVVGAGAGGIPIADKLSEAGKSVLLIEKGPPSTGRWGGNLKPSWLQGTDLTRFDVPGLCNQIWVDSNGIACDDTDQMAGCVLGGGTAVNAGLWWKPYTPDWDQVFPSGWKASDMAGATSRVFNRIPGTETPSQDGKRYRTEGLNTLMGGLKSAGWAEVSSLREPDRKNRTVMPGPFMFANGERGGPLATYLDTASKRSNFKLWMNTAVKRVVREGGHVTGLEVEPFRNGGYVGTVQLTPGTGRVILSAGTFGSAKLLMRSGIGRKDQLEIVKGSRDGPTMVDEASWIPLPVGDNLVDHVNTDTVVSHPNVVFYDFYEAWTSPNPADKDAYLSKRSGILAQAAPNIGPLFFDQIRGADGKTRHIQWTARVEGSLGAPNGKTMTMSQYLGTGSTSRGQMSITSGLSTVVSTHPYLHTEGDKAAVIQGIVNIQNALKGVTGLKFEFPNATTTAADYVASMPVSPSNRRANHWMGTAKLGTDDGRQSGGTAVVDTNTRVFGTDNLFVVDASIFPGMVTTNPSAYIVVASERAAERILALPPSTPLPRYSQCGGRAHTGSFQCAAPYTCQVQNEYYSQCL